MLFHKGQMKNRPKIHLATADNLYRLFGLHFFRVWNMIKDCKKRKCLLPIETLGSDKRFYIEEKDVRRICANMCGGGIR